MIFGWASHDLTTMSQEEEAFGIYNGMLSTYVDFVQSPSFPIDYAKAAHARKAALLIAWEPWDWSAPIGEQPNLAPRRIADGDWDTHIMDWLRTAQSWATKINVIVRFAPEMNDTQRPWANSVPTVGYEPTTPQEYINMWGRVHNLKQQFAPNVKLMWNPLNYGAGQHPFSAYFPGESYVDMVALNGFNWSKTQDPGGEWQNSNDVFSFSTKSTTGPIHDLVSLAPNKPWGLAEVACAPDNPADFLPGGVYASDWGSWVFDYPDNPPYEENASDWITQEGWTTMMLLRAFNFGASFVGLFHTNKETDWRLTDTKVGREVPSRAMAYGAQLEFGQDPSNAKPPVLIPNLSWSERVIENGVDRGVVYLDNSAVAWHGLTAVSESPDTLDIESYYMDGMRRINVPSTYEVDGEISAFSLPEALSSYLGTRSIALGFYGSNIRPKPFGLSYRTRIGGSQEGYKIHILYNVTMNPTSKEFETLSDSSDPSEFSWEFKTMPVRSGVGFGSSSFELDSRLIDPVKLYEVESILYGNDVNEARLPTPDEIVDILAAE